MPLSKELCSFYDLNQRGEVEEQKVLVDLKAGGEKVGCFASARAQASKAALSIFTVSF